MKNTNDFTTETYLERRSGGTRQERQSFLILCEGKTEKQYFTGMRTRRGPQINVDAPDCDHVKVVQEARKRMTDEYDGVWCVLDTELDRGLTERILRAAKEEGVDVALSTPSFEVWLVLHHMDRTAPFQSAQEAERTLTRALPRWKKSRTDFADFAPGVNDACRRARALEPTGEEHLKNPSTSVWKLIDRLRGVQTG